MAKVKGKQTAETGMSKSKAKREARKKQVEQMQRQRRITKIAGTVVAALLVIVIAALIGKQLYIMAIRTTPNEDFSAGLTADGKIENVNPADLLTLVDYENIPVPAEEVAATQEEVDNRIDSVLEANKELSTDDALAVADGDVVNIDYVGSVEGVEFDGGSAEGYELTIGSGSFIDDFEQQLIGHKPGEKVIVEVTFPAEYERNPVLANQDASFDVTVNGIMVKPELTDEFVAEHLAPTEEVSTVEEYRAKVENEFYEAHLEEYLTNYIIENSTVNSYPKDYIKAIKSNLKYGDGTGADTGDEISYEKQLTERAQDVVKEDLVYQAIFEKAGLSLDMEAYLAQLNEANGEDYTARIKEYYGENYMAQARIRQLVIDYLVELYR